MKTGALRACAASSGSILVGGPSESTRALFGFGMQLGLAFQAIDDWLGIWGDPTRTGKPRASDIRQRKASLPIVMAMGHPGTVGQAIRDWMTSTGPIDTDRVERVVDCLEDAEIEAKTIAFAKLQLDGALAGLDRTRLDPAARDELRLLARFVVEREL